MAVLTNKFYMNSVDNFVNQIKSGTKSYYVYVGKADPWLNSVGENIDTTPPSAVDSVSESELTVYDSMIFAKEIGSSDVIHMIPRYDWTSGTIYDHYDQNDSQLYTKKYYVVNDKFDVYKCIFNNYGGESTVKPDLPTTSGVFNTSDGYVWKYMFSIEPSANTKFTSNTFIPVTANADVKTYAVNGSIDYIKVDAGGSDYQGYANGFLTAYVNNYVVQLADDSSPYNNFYTNSSIYLKAGFGAGQIRQIRNYSGLTKQVIVTKPFDVFNHFSLDDIQGSQNIQKGLTVTQRFDKLSVNYLKGYFNIGDIVVQSDINAYGFITAANSTVIDVVKTSTNSFTTNLPIYNASQSGTLKSGTVTINASSIYVNSVSSTALPTDYPVGSYIRVGGASSNNIRRVVSVNTTVIEVDTAFNNTLVANAHYNVGFAANPTSITILNSNGVVSDINLNGVQLAISNLTNYGYTYNIGENVNMVDINNVNQLANGIVVFANTTDIILDNIQGTFSTGYYLLGLSSLQKSQIDYVTVTPSITISNPSGKFITGQKIFFRPTADLTQSVANATLTGSYITPNELTEYIISPTVTVNGDGEGALAYSTVDPTINAISSIVVVNTGFGYTYANIAITSNSIHGANAVASPIISPIRGHGYNPESELSAKYAGITVSIDTAANENYVFPSYGQYRKIGVIEQPLFENIVISVDNFERAKLSLDNRTNTFVEGEVVVQSNNNGVAVVVYSNSTFMEIKNIGGGNWTANVEADDIYGFTSGATANVKTFDTTYFSLGANVEVVSEVNSGGTGRITQVISNNSIRLTDVTGKFDINDTIIDAASNTYANVTAIYTSNGGYEVGSTFGNRVNQTARITLNTHYGIFQKFEYVNQAVSKARGLIIDVDNEVDLAISNLSGTFNIGDTITSSNVYTNASATVIFANSSYMKLTSVGDYFYSTDSIINNSLVSADIDSVYQVLVLSDISGPNKFQTGANVITGETSGAFGTSAIANTISYPNLVRESGSVLYVENIAPFERSNTTVEDISLIIKF